MKRFGILFLISVMVVESVWAARLKDIAKLRGVRDNQLVGYGLVVGLAGTGDGGLDITEKTLKMVLRGLAVNLKAQNIGTKNAAVVLVSARLRPFTRVGASLDITLASIGTATKLDGGTLVMTPLRGADGNVYAMAQGKIPPSIRKKMGITANSESRGVSASIPGGGILEKEIEFDISKIKEIRYLLRSPDFTTAARTARRINEELGAKYAQATDAATIEIAFPMGFEGNLVELIARIENVQVESAGRAKVVINKETGTVILGEHVTIASVGIAHNNLRITVEKPQPIGPRSISSKQKASEPIEQSVMLSDGGTNVAEVVSSLNAMGVEPNDLIAILQSLKKSGALMAELEIE